MTLGFPLFRPFKGKNKGKRLEMTLQKPESACKYGIFGPTLRGRWISAELLAIPSKDG